MAAHREATQARMHRERIEKARCALLASPDVLAGAVLEDGTVVQDVFQDSIRTKEDFDAVKLWLNRLNVSFTDVFNAEHQALTFPSMCRSAFSMSFAAMQDTAFVDAPELVLMHYGGHGVDPNFPLCSKYSSRPAIDFGSFYNDVTAAYSLWEHRPLAGGELCLHYLGFAGLRFLLAPFAKAVLSGSQNSKSNALKTNKHFIAVFDSCFSGRLASELHDPTLTKLRSDIRERKCTITVQAACSADEVTYGGYFTTTFLQLQSMSVVQSFAAEWDALLPDKRQEFQSLPLPSPCVSSTREDFDPTALYYEVTIQNVPLVLFPHAGFFKFCAVRLQEQKEAASSIIRSLTATQSDHFMSSGAFNVTDAKLKFYDGRPFGLFALQDPTNSQHIVCAHVHFGPDTTTIGRINLQHHLKDNKGLWTICDGPKWAYGMKAKAGISNPNPGNQDHWQHWPWASENQPDLQPAKALVMACHTWLEANFSGLWSDLARWGAKAQDMSLLGTFKSHRSRDFQSYMESIDGKVPTLANLRGQK